MKYIFFLSFFFLRTILAGDISVEMKVTSNSITLQDQIELVVEVNGTQSASEPEILGSDNFLIEEAGSSSQIHMVNGVTSITKSFQMLLMPKREGEFTLGPAVVEVDGTQYKSQSIVIKVAKSNQRETGQGAPAPENKNFFVEAVVDKTAPYVNEQFIYTFRLFTRVGISNANLDLPEFKGFWKEPLGDQRKYQKNINGIPWQVMELSFLLTPLRAGKSTIGETRLFGEVLIEGSDRRRSHSLIDQFFGGRYTERKRVQLMTKPLGVEVLELPGDHPSSFSGLVGNFSISTQIDKDSLKMGESVTLTVLLSGSGALENASLPSEETDDFKFYDDKPTLSKNLTDKGVISTKIFKRAIVPKKEGTLNFGPIKLLVFNPQSHVYQTIQANALILNVLPGDGNDINHTVLQASTGKKNIEVLGQDLMPIRYSLDSFGNSPLGRGQKLVLVLIILGLPLVYSVLHLVIARQLLFKGDINLARKTKAAKEFRVFHKTLLKSPKFMEDSLNLLKDYLGNKLNLDGRSITQFDIERILLPYQVSPSTLQVTKEIFDVIEKAQYGGGVLSENDKHNISAKIKMVFEKFEKEMTS